LDSPIDGVPDAMRQNYQQSIKDIATSYAQNYYNIKDPKEAYARITSDPNVGTFLGEVATKIPAQINSAITAFNQSAQTVDENRVNQFINLVNPSAAADARAKWLTDALKMSPDDRARYVSAMYSKLDPQLTVGFDLPETLNALDRMADPKFQADRQATINAQVQKNIRDLRPDPTLNPAAAQAAGLIAQIPKVIVESTTGAIGQSLMLSEIYQGTVERLKADHPDWSDDQIKDAAGRSSLAQLGGAEVINRVAGARLGGVTAGIENPLARIAASALVHSSSGAAGGAAQQIGGNIAEGRDPFQDVASAALGGAVLTLPGGIAGGFHKAPAKDVQTSGDTATRVEQQNPPIHESPVPPVEQQPPPVNQPVTGFTTAKGSTYEVHDDGTTTRNKATRPEHPGDEGPQPQSQKTVYLNPENADALATPVDASWRIIDHGDGTLSLATQNKDGRWGIASSQRAVPVSDTPSVGAIPLELWKQGETNGLPSYGQIHFGNPITELRTGPVETRGQPPQTQETHPLLQNNPNALATYNRLQAQEPYDAFQYLHHLWSISSGDPNRGPEPVWREPTQAEELTDKMSARVTKGNEARATQPQPEPEPDQPIKPINYTPSQNVPARLADLVKTDSLKDAANAAAKQISNPAARDIAQHVANLVPPDAKIAVADFTQPITANGHQYTGELSAGLYHPDSRTALISDQTTNPLGAVLHEATHAALNDAILNPDKLSPDAKAGVEQIISAYNSARDAAPPVGRRPQWMQYALSSPEEFASATVSDPRMQQYLQAISGQGDTPSIARQLLSGAARILGIKPAAAQENLYNQALAGMTKVDQVPLSDKAGGPIYAANPFGQLGAKGLPHWMVSMERKARQMIATTRANLDATPETRPLSAAMDKADNLKDSLVGQRMTDMMRIKKLAGSGAQAKRVMGAYERLAEAVDKGAHPSTVPEYSDPVVKELWDTFARHKAEDAQFMRDNGFQVQQSDGTWRPFIGLKDPSMYVARRMRDDVSEALRAPRNPDGSYTKEFTRIFNEGLQKGFFRTPDELEAYVQHIGQGLTQGPRQTQLETAREVKFPSFFFDYSIDGQLRSIAQSADTRARLASFGQSRPGVPDLFQKSIEDINASKNLTAYQKQLAAYNVQMARDEWYHQNQKGLYGRELNLAKSISSAIQTGNYYTSLKVGIGRLFFSMQNKGFVNTTNALIRTLADYGANKELARELGIIRDNVSFAADDLFTPENGYRKAMNIARQVLELAGHG
jgi:hypothetical protein